MEMEEASIPNDEMTLVIFLIVFVKFIRSNAA
jgi:hypothetical protein